MRRWYSVTNRSVSSMDSISSPRTSTVNDVFSDAIPCMTSIACCRSIPATYRLEKNLTIALGVIGMNAMMTRPNRFIVESTRFGT